MFSKSMDKGLHKAMLCIACCKWVWWGWMEAGCFTHPHGGGHIPELLVGRSVLHIGQPEGRKDKSAAFDGSQFNGWSRGAPDGRKRRRCIFEIWRSARLLLPTHRMNQLPDGGMNRDLFEPAWRFISWIMNIRSFDWLAMRCSQRTNVLLKRRDHGERD